MRKFIEFIIKHLVQLLVSMFLGAVAALALVKHAIVTGQIGIFVFMLTSYLVFKFFVLLKRKIFYTTMAMLFLPTVLLANDGGNFLQQLDWQSIVNVLFTVLVVAFPSLFLKFRTTIGKIKDLVGTLDEAVKDGKLTKEEIGEIVKKFKEIF